MKTEYSTPMVRMVAVKDIIATSEQNTTPHIPLD